jgi:hypothetical protein
MKATATIYVPEGIDPFANYTSRPKATKVHAFRLLLKAIVGGGIQNRSANRPTVVAGTAYARGTVTMAAPNAADTVTINGQALTATQHHATGTVTITAAGVDVDDTVTINGYAFTAKATEALASGHFQIGGTDTEAATSLAACINASTNVLISGIVTATSASGVVTIRAVSAGTGGNSLTLASSDAQLAVSAANLANGAAVGNNEWDYVGSNIQDATALVTCINASSTAIVSDHVKASNLAGTVVCASVAAGDTVTVAGVKLKAVGAASALPDEWAMSGTDTQDAAALVTLVNAHPTLKEIVFASNSSGTVTIRQLPFGPGVSTALPLASSNGTRLAVTAIAATAVVFLVSTKKGTGGNQATLASADGTRLAVSAARLAGGTDSTLTF